MLSRNENDTSMQKRTFFNIDTPKGALGDPQEQEPMFLGWGACRSCGCTGYISAGGGSHTCKGCGHHFSQHK